jgi:hypothetical protein
VAADHGGLLAIALGATLRREGAVLGWSVIVGGGAAAAAGLVLVWVRSRMGDPPPQRPQTPTFPRRRRP